MAKWIRHLIKVTVEVIYSPVDVDNVETRGPIHKEGS